MAYSKKTWINRVSQYPNRRTITENGSSKTVTVARNEGTVTTTGDAFDASTMNDFENRINSAFTSVDNKIENLPYCSVAYIASSPANTSFSSAPIVFNTVDRDTHNGYSTSTGIYTCPIAGVYIVCVNYYSNSYSSGTARPRIYHANSSGSLYPEGGVQLLGQNAASICDIFYCLQGDQLYFGPQTGSTSYAVATYTGRYHNSMSIACLRQL